MRRNFDLLIADFEHAVRHSGDPERERHLRTAALNVGLFYDSLVAEPFKTQQLVQVTRAVRETTGAGRTGTEEKLMEHLGELARQCRLAVEDAGVKHLSGLDAFGQVPSSAQPALETLQTLCGYASECLAYAKPRDASNGQRRSLAFEILAQAGGLIDLPEVVALARRSLRKVNGREVRGAFVFLREHYASRDQAPEDPIIEALLALSEATDSRTNASGALSVLVETGAMSESEALGRMDDWKDSHWGR